MRLRLILPVLLFLGALVSVATGQQKASVDDVLLRVSGSGIQDLSLSHEAFAKLPRTKVDVDVGDGKHQRYEGVSLLKVLETAGAPTGGKLKGKSVATYVVAHARDGYQALFAIAEIDPDFSGSEVLIADTVDGKPLSGEEGKLRLVVPRDKRHARWVRMLERLEVVTLT